MLARAQHAPHIYFVSLDGRAIVGFKRDAVGRVVASSGGSWRVVEKIR